MAEAAKTNRSMKLSASGGIRDKPATHSTRYQDLLAEHGSSFCCSVFVAVCSMLLSGIKQSQFQM